MRLLDLTWLLANCKNFVNFVNILGDSSSEQIYTTELISTLLDEFWEENYKKILWKCLVPWVVYAGCTLSFFASALSNDYNRTWTVFLGCSSLVLLSYQVLIEIRQNKG